MTEDRLDVIVRSERSSGERLFELPSLELIQSSFTRAIARPGWPPTVAGNDRSPRSVAKDSAQSDESEHIGRCPAILLDTVRRPG